MLVYLFDKVLFLSLAGGAAILAVGLFCALGGKWLTCRWRYYIWLLPMLLLLLPVALPAIGAPTAPAVSVQAPATVPDVSVGTPVGGEAHIAPPSVAVPQISEVKPETAAPAPPVRKSIQIPLLPILWLAGIAALSLWHLIERLRFRRFARRATDPAQEWEVAILNELRSNIGLHKNIGLRRFHGLGSPFLCGVLRPTVYLPAVELTRAELRRVLTHELTHCRRRDLVVKLLVRAVRVLHWYNPLVWLMERRVGTWCELSCDEAVVEALGHGERQEYGLTILKLIKGERSTAPVSAYLAEKEIKNRLEVIMREKHGGWARRVLAVGLSLALCLGCTALAAEVGAKNPNQNNGITYVTTTFTEVSLSREELQTGTPTAMTDWAQYIPGTGSANAVTGTAKLVDLPGRQSFSADVVVDNLRKQLYSREYLSGPTGFHVEMTKLTGVSAAAGSWSGLFTVEQDGKVVFQDMPGTMSGVPSLDGESITSLFVEKLNGSCFRLNMSFGLAGGQAAQAKGEEAAAERAVEKAADVQTYYLTNDTGTVNGIAVNATDRTGSLPDIYISNSIGQLIMSSGMTVTGAQPTESGVRRTLNIILEPWDIISFQNGAVRGVFRVKDSEYSYVGQFTGTLSGLNGEIGDSLTLRSDDGKTNLTFDIAEPDWTYDEEYERSSGRRGELTMPMETYQPLVYAADTMSFETITPEELPFELSWDKAGLALEYTGPAVNKWVAALYNEAGVRWYFYGIADYAATHEGYPMFQGAYQCRRTESDAVGNTVTLPFAGLGSDQYYLYFANYSAEQGAACAAYRVEISLVEQQVLLTSCRLDYSLSNPNVPTELSLPLLKMFMSDWVFEA